MLIAIQPDWDVQLTFPSDPAVPLLHQLPRPPTNAPYLLIDRMEHLGRIYNSGGDTGWCIIIDAGEHVIKVVRVGDDLTLSADEITMLLTDGLDDVRDPNKDITYILRHRAR